MQAVSHARKLHLSLKRPMWSCCLILENFRRKTQTFGSEIVVNSLPASNYTSRNLSQRIIRCAKRFSYKGVTIDFAGGEGERVRVREVVVGII